jgi:hypothetical protein
MSKVSTEQLLTSPQGFGIATASPAQRAACRILDGEPLGDLRAHPDAIALVGGVDAIAALPSERGIAPTEVALLAAIRTSKTIIACAAALRASQSVDVSRLGPGEVPRVSLVSLKLDTSAVAHRLLTETMRASPTLKGLMLDDTADTLTVRHPSGRPIEIACVAGSKAGAGLVARWSAGVIFDEAPRMNGAGDGVVNLSDMRAAILGRLLPGAQALYIGSPWSPHGDVYDMVEQSWGKPTRHMVVLRGTGPMLNPVWWTPERAADLEEKNPTAYRTECLGEFADPESGLLNPVAVACSTRAAPLELEWEQGAQYFAAVDPSDGLKAGNGFTLAIVARVTPEPPTKYWGEAWSRPPGDMAPRFRVVLTREWRGLSPASCWREISKLCRTYKIRRARTDQFAASANADLARMCGIDLHVDRASATSNLEDWTNFQTLLHNDRIELSPDPVLRRDLLGVKRRITQGASKIVLARTTDGRHSDSASALCAAVKEATFAVPLLRPVHFRGL